MDEITLNNDQIYAIYAIENWYDTKEKQVFNLSGAAGTGKTTLIKYFIEKVGIGLENAAFVSYMGKAAMQMARNGLPAQTIHSFIYDVIMVPSVNEKGEINYAATGLPIMVPRFVRKEKLPKHLKIIVIDEASMVNEAIAKDILSFGIPIIALGDMNQLPPVFGKPFFLNDKDIDYKLTTIMRQNENNPIIWLAHQVLENQELKYGQYGESSVLRKEDMNESLLKNSDIVLTCTNSLRHKVNKIFRENILGVSDLKWPQEGEKIICRKNNWKRNIHNILFLTNGMTGTVDYIDQSQYKNDSFIIDFKPDFTKKSFKNLRVNYSRLIYPEVMDNISSLSIKDDLFEFAYAITVHLSQGSQWNNVIFMLEQNKFPKDIMKKLKYTAITRAVNKITIVI